VRALHARGSVADGGGGWFASDFVIDAIKATGKPFVVVLFNGRPLTLGAVDAASPAILEAWFPGVEAGNAVADVLFGRSTRAASRRSRSRGRSARCRSSTTTSRPGVPASRLFTLDRSDFGFYGNAGRFLVEPGRIDVYAGTAPART
jgi:hypothetical protein